MKITKKSLIDLGFMTIDTFTNLTMYHYDLGRSRYLSINDVETIDETACIQEYANDNDTILTDLIILHSTCVDGPITIKKINGLIKYLSNEK